MRVAITILMSALFLAFAGSAQAETPKEKRLAAHGYPQCSTWKCAAKVKARYLGKPRKRCNETRSVTHCIRWAARKYGVSESLLRTIAWRESNFNPKVCNTQGSGACGLFQFMPALWGYTPYGRYSRFDAKYASLAAAWCFSRGLASHWATYGY